MDQQELSDQTAGVTKFTVVTYVALVLLTVAIGAFAWHDKFVLRRPDSAAQSQQLRTYTDSAKHYTFQYPAGWSLNLGQGSGEGPAPDWSKESRPVAVIPSDAPDPSAGVFIEALTGKMADDMVTGMNDSAFDTVSATVIGGKAAYYDRLNFTGPSSAERYIDSNYLIPNGDKSYWITFRESYYHNYPYASWSNHDIAALRQVVYSIKFLD